MNLLPFELERIKGNFKHYNECVEKYQLLLGDISRYNLTAFLDYGDTYIVRKPECTRKITIQDEHNEEHIMLFRFRCIIEKDDNLNSVFSENIIERESDNIILIEKLTPNELKSILVKIFGY